MTKIDYGQTKLLKEHDAAIVLNIEVTTLRRWRWAGTGPSFRKIGAAVRYHIDDIDQFIEAAVRISTSDTEKEDA